MRLKRTRRSLAAAVALIALTGAGAPAPDVNRFIIPAEAAKNAKTRHEISRDTARRIADACIRLATARNTPISIFILAPSDEIVFAERMDGQGRSISRRR
jgi:hypothetical protein